MKYLASLALLVVLGCSKCNITPPKPDSAYYDPAYGKTLINNIWVSRNLPPEGVTWHVTQEQWEAAQGLYHSSLACNENQHWEMKAFKGQLPPGEFVKGQEPDTFWHCAADSK
jgi:hypothetical protein